MQILNYQDTVKPPYNNKALVREDFIGFKEDYLVLHCLIKKYSLKSFMEIGTSVGLGTNVICNAIGIKRFLKYDKSLKVYSLDVPPNFDPKIIYPEGEDGHPKIAGKKCKYFYTQLFGNSLTFDFTPYYPLDGWFIDGKHNYFYVKNDSLKAFDSKPKIIIWHDFDNSEVKNAVIEVSKNFEDTYDFFNVKNTRMTFALRRDLNLFEIF